MTVDAVQIRVLGCLLEKQRTTPDQYPLSLNALRLACNQSTNRDPVVAYDERAVHLAAQELGRLGWARLASGQGSRAIKYRQLFTEAMGLGEDDAALLTVLMLRGPQTPGELKQRTERLHPFASLAEVDATLDRLVARELVERLGRRPGQKEERFHHLLGGDDETPPPPPRPSPEVDVAPLPRVPVAAERVVDDDLRARVARLEEEVARLREALEARLGGAEDS